MRVVHLSDLHLGWNGQTNYERLKRIFENLALQAWIGEAVIIITGDLIEDNDDTFTFKNGETEISKTVQRVMDDLLLILRKAASSVLVVPGNHDYYRFKGNGFIYCKDCVRDFNSEIYGISKISFPIIHRSNEAVFIGLNTAHPGFFASGKLGTKQRESLIEILERYKDDTRKKIIYMHHHPISVKRAKNELYKKGMELVDAEEFQEIVRNYAIEYVLFGHRHTWRGDYPIGKTRYMNTGATSGKDVNKSGIVRTIHLDSGMIDVFNL